MNLMISLLSLILSDGTPIGPASSGSHDEMTLEDFSPGNHLEWQIINDGVMGGLSEGRFRINSDQTADFWGIVSLENNGGFASVRAVLNETVPGDFKKLKVRVKGDGKSYSFRIRTDENQDGAAYAVSFQTRKDEWTEHEFSPDDFTPTFRGRTLSHLPPLKDLKLKQIGFLISDKQAGGFNLKIGWIKVVR